MSPFWDWIGLERFEVLQGTDAKEILSCWFGKYRGMWQEVWAQLGAGQESATLSEKKGEGQRLDPEEFLPPLTSPLPHFSPGPEQ